MSRIRLAVIGAGAIGRKHIDVINQVPQAELVAIADPSPQAEALARTLGVAWYAEVEAIVLGKKPRTQYYTEENGLVIRDTVSLNGNDWTFAQHRVIDTMPTGEDFRKTVADYLAWKVSQAIKGDGGYGV